MRVLLVVGVVILILFVAGIIRFESSDNEARIHIDTQKIENGKNKVVEEGRELLQQTTERWDENDENGEHDDGPDRTGSHHSPVRPTAANSKALR